ncbi:MAG: hypothetical protein ACREAS_08825 [Nitrososphaera sp.]
MRVQESLSERNARRLEEKAKISEQIIESKSQMQWQMVKLEAMGFGLKQLKRLYNVVKEIDEANGFSETDGYAVKIFLDQVELYYDPLLGFEKRIDESRVEFHNLNMQHLIQLNTIYALPYVGSALAHLLNRGLREDQIVKLANLLEMHPEMIQSFLQDNSGNEGEQHEDGLKSMSPLSSSAFSYRPSLSSSSKPPSPSSFQPQSPQTSRGPTFRKSASTPLTEPYSTAATTKQSVDSSACDKGSDIQSFARSLLEQPSIKVQDDSPGVASLAPKQGESSHRDRISRPVDTRPKDHNQNQEQINPTLTWTATFLGMEVGIPKSILLGLKQSNSSQEFLLDTSEGNVSQSFREQEQHR